MDNFSFIERNIILTNIEDKQYDLIIIGGGITGTGIALDASTRGMKTLLIEMQDFAAGTSSRSTKLVHGGLRYLKQFEVKMVADVGKEREIVFNNAPHVTHPEWMLLPIYKKGSFGKYSTSVGLKVYDFLAGVKRNERRKMLSSQETLEKEPLLNTEGLIGGGYYVEYRTDDARLTIEVAKKAYELGAELLNYVKVEGFDYNTAGKIAGVRLNDQLTGDVYHVQGKKVVNASGPWVEQLIGMDKKIKNKSLQHTKGVHIVLDQSRFPLKQPVYFDTPDSRMVFAIPRNGKAYVGTTDTVFEEDLINPKVTMADKKYILDCIKFIFPTTNLGIEDIESTWAGIRPLIRQEGKDPSEISRKDEIWTSDTGMITIAGGKLTGYRKMAETVTDLLCKEFNEKNIDFGKSTTKKMKLSGGDFQQPEDYRKFIIEKSKELTILGISNKDARNIVSTFGTNTDKILTLIDKLNEESMLPLPIKLILQYAISFEMVITPSDFFMRRTGTVLFDIEWAKKWKQEIIDYMDSVIKWSPERKKVLTQELDELIVNALGEV